ncbi:MAG: 4Fe-4S binding protein [Anaerotignaceae bacterium]
MIDKNEIIRIKGQGFLFNRDSQDEFNVRIVTKNGQITAQQMECVAKAAKDFGNGGIAFTSRMCIELTGVKYENEKALQNLLATADLKTGGTGDKIRPVVSCKGKTCVFGLAPSADIAKTIHDRFYEGYRQVELPHKFKIAVGGCPNNCVKPDLNDIGLVGQNKPTVKTELCKSCGKCLVENGCLVGAAKKDNNGIIAVDENRCDGCGKCIKNCPFKAMELEKQGVKIVIGGRWGREGKKGNYIKGVYSIDEALDIIEKIILVYRDNAYKKERFAKTIERLGFEKIENLILQLNILDKKQEILNKEIAKLI